MDLDGAGMRYLRTGSGPALILLHGLLGYSFSWRYTMPALAPYAGPDAELLQLQREAIRLALEALGTPAAAPAK